MRPIPRFEKLYSITEDGRVWSHERKDALGRLWPGKWLKPQMSSSGYFHVSLYRNKSVKIKKISRLILEAFVGPCPPGMDACHNNGCRTDDRLGNLRWDTRKANIQDAVRQGTHSGFIRGEGMKNAKLTDENVRKIRKLKREGHTHREMAEAFGVSKTTISGILSGIGWRHVI